VNINAQRNAITLIKSSTGSKTLELIAFVLYTGMYCSTCIYILYKYIYCEEEFQNLSQSTTYITTSLPSSFHQKTYKIAHIHHLSNVQFPVYVLVSVCPSCVCVSALILGQVMPPASKELRVRIRVQLSPFCRIRVRVYIYI